MQNNIPISKLTPKQRAIIKEIIILFYEKFNGSSSIVVTDRILSHLEERGVCIGDAQFRAYLGVIRYNDSCSKYLKKFHGRVQHAFIVGTNEGYYWTEDLEEMKAFWKSQHGRVCKIMQNAKPLYKLMGWSEEQMKIMFDNNESAA